MALVWENLFCDGQGSLCDKILLECCCAKKKRNILTNLNGRLNFGELTALMGPSGAGKSTLLNCITQGENYVGVRGRIAVGSQSKMRSVLITQNEKDHLLVNLTVTESLYYASEMKNSYKTSRREHEAIVQGLLADLDLLKVGNTTVEKCSGGQKKRIAIGLELTGIIKPNFLFLDEPTSGLDSHSGFNVIFRLRILAQQLNIAVVTVIHQPSFEIFSQFHNVYILSKVGSCIFHGSPARLQSHLIAFGYPCNTNPADTIISIASSISNEDDDEVNPINVDVEAGNSSVPKSQTKDMKVDCEKMTKAVEEHWKRDSRTRSGIEIQKQGLCSYSTKFKIYTLYVLFKRTCITSLLRQKQLVFMRLALHVAVAGVLTCLYNRNIGVESGCYANGFDPHNCSCVESEDKMRHESVPFQNIKFQFFSLLFLMFAALMPTVLTFPAEIKLFINEHRNGWYSTSSYYISKTLTEIPCQLLFSFLYVYFLYWYTQQIGMDDWYGGLFGYMSWRYAYFLGVIVVSCFIAQGFGFLIGIICVNSFTMAIILSSTTLIFLFLFSGFFVKTVDMNIYTEWITYLSFIRFSFESIVIVLYGEKRCEFLPNTQIPAKSAILFSFDLSDDDLNANTYWLIGHLIVIRILAFIFLKIEANPKFIRTSLSCSFIFNYILPKLKTLMKNIGKLIFLLLKVAAAILVINVVMGIVVYFKNKSLNASH